MKKRLLPLLAAMRGNNPVAPKTKKTRSELIEIQVKKLRKATGKHFVRHLVG